MKQKNVETNDVAKVEATEEVVEQKEVVEVQPQEPKTKAPKKEKSKPEQKKADKKQKEHKQSKLGKKVKETASELKKVSWPTFGSVLKKTGVVLAVVLIFAVVLFGIDRLLTWLFELLTSAMR